MTKDEIINLLCTKNIIVEISGEYHLTERYKELLANETSRVVMPAIPKTTPTELNYDELLNTKTNGQDWPISILENKGRLRATAFVVACEVPAVAPKGYRLKGLDKEAIHIINNIIESPDIDPNTMIEAVTLYYQYTEMPKSIKNLCVDGDILDIYNEHIEGALKPGLIDQKENPNRWH